MHHVANSSYHLKAMTKAKLGLDTRVHIIIKRNRKDYHFQSLSHRAILQFLNMGNDRLGRAE